MSVGREAGSAARTPDVSPQLRKTLLLDEQFVVQELSDMSDCAELRLRVFSLNCWGVRYLSKHCCERFALIADLLRRERPDVALLQEVWCEKDFVFLKKNLSSVYSYSYHFKSGFLGSGLVVFSRHRIHDALLYRYSLNGYPYMPHHGDWFAGKAVGKVLLRIAGLAIHVFVTHLHAEYSREKDHYLPHRVVQAWELLQFIRHTSAGADVVIVAGDLNMHPEDLGTRLLRNHTGLLDCFTHARRFHGCDGGSTHISQNIFTHSEELAPFGGGIRIDYVFFKASAEVDMCCESLSTTTGPAPGQPFPYSDHEALSADFLLKLTSQKATEKFGSRELICSTEHLPELVNTLMEAGTEVKVGLHCAERKRHTAARTGTMGLVLVLLELIIAAVPVCALGSPQPFPTASFYLLGALCFAILLSTVLLYVFYSMEVKALQGAEDQMRLSVAALQERLKETHRAQSSDQLQKPSGKERTERRVLPQKT